MTYHVNNTYAKLAPDSILNKKNKEIMRYTGGHRTSPNSMAQAIYKIVVVVVIYCYVPSFEIQADIFYES